MSPGKRRVWTAATPRVSRPSVPEALKERVQREGDALVAEVLRARAVKPPPENPAYNYITDVFTRWYRSWFYFCATYTCPSPRALSETFEVRFARMEYAGGENFHLAFMRYTGEWIEIYRDVPLDRALAAIRDDVYFRKESF
jgi:hypothetical protein